MVLIWGRQPLTVDSELSFPFANFNEIDLILSEILSRPHDLSKMAERRKNKIGFLS